MHPRAIGRFPAIHNSYLDTASYGIPPDTAVRAMAGVLDAWTTGTAYWPADWDPAGDRCRAYAASILGTTTARVALLPSVSVGAALAVSPLAADDVVVVADDEFSSLNLPLWAAAHRVGARVNVVRFNELVKSIGPRTRAVLLSHVRSNDGRVADLPAIVAAAHRFGSLVILDATHSAGVLPIETDALGIDVVVAAAYKHLLCPRGTAFMAVGDQALSQMAPLTASWRGTRPSARRYFGSDLTDLHADARRLDVSLAWLSWVGAEESLAFICCVPEPDRKLWCTGLATLAAEELGLPATGSSILSIPVKDDQTVSSTLARKGLRVSSWAGSIRASFHLYNSESDVSELIQVVKPWLD